MPVGRSPRTLFVVAFGLLSTLGLYYRLRSG